MLDFTKNYFELFGLPQAFRIDAEALAERYRELQRITHPDRYASGSDRERRLALQGAALVNEAYETLKNPMLRARYLLSLLGVCMDERGESTHDGAFLMEQMEMREALEEVRQQDDPYGETAKLMDQVDQKIQQMVGQMALQFEQSSPEQLEQVRENVRKMQFLQKLHRDIEAVEQELDDLL